jgi:hypothetical protein
MKKATSAVDAFSFEAKKPRRLGKPYARSSQIIARWTMV